MIGGGGHREKSGVFTKEGKRCGISKKEKEDSRGERRYQLGVEEKISAKQAGLQD